MFELISPLISLLLSDELKSFSHRVEYTSEGTCNCFYLELHEQKNWGVARLAGKNDPDERLG